MESKISTKDIVMNTDRRFGSVQRYQACTIDGVPALFTIHACEIAKQRAANNPEDIPKDESFWSFLGL